MGEQVQNPAKTAVQWQTKDRTSHLAGTMRLTSDLALVHDDTYLTLMKHWACDQQKLDVAFAASWKKLVESGGGWLAEADQRCEPQSKATGQLRDPNKDTHSSCSHPTTIVPTAPEFSVELNGAARLYVSCMAAVLLF